ncbi:MAG: restriction endonuclease subunit S [Candidatus Accumulibacter sp.]|jgi:type I restriction enzyme S subunit|uniref:restriction endonuclease subunit S n=1 Tax=Accumulibacter sp. TaxID=2053492 RepID=UPI0025828B1B|nr:restriction endonuclease subunit S [Accumulibacter sp.]MBK8115271.1 restriction endonuclease subunit S [Accumulibacter sp.]
MSDVPAGWTTEPLGRLCEINPKHSPSISDDASVSFVPMSAIDHVHGRITVRESRRYGNVRKGYTHFSDGDVLFAKITPCMENGNCAVAGELEGGIACGSTEFFVFRSTGVIEPRYLYRFLRQDSFRRSARKAMAGAVGQARVSKAYMETAELPLPPLNEQRRIVAKLDALFEKSRAIRDKLNRLPRLLDQLQKSILNAAFRGDLTREWRAQHPDLEPASKLLERIRAERRAKWEADLIAKGKNPTKAEYFEPDPGYTDGLPELPKGWCWMAIGEFGFVKGGKRLPAGHDYADQKTANPYVRVTDMHGGSIKTEQLRYLNSNTASALSNYVISADDVYISIAGSIGLVGRIPKQIDGANLTENAAKIVLAKLVSPDYLWTFLASDVAQHQIRDLTISTTQPKLALFRIEQVFVPLPPLTEQASIAEIVISVRQQIEIIRLRLKQAEQRLALTDRQILERAFRGELVPQDPTDEPASVLLERIRAERAAAGPSRRPRTKRLNSST